MESSEMKSAYSSCKYLLVLFPSTNDESNRIELDEDSVKPNQRNGAVAQMSLAIGLAVLYVWEGG